MPNLEIDGVRWHYEEAGQGPAVLFVHGWGASWRFFESALARFSTSRRCIALDWKGMADSDKPRAEYSMEEYAAELKRFADRLGLDRFVLVGHSMGGMISTLFALEHPDRLQGVGLVNAPLRGPTALFFLVRLLVLPILCWIIWICSRLAWVRRLAARDFTCGVRLPDWVFDHFAKMSYRALFRTHWHISTTDLSDRLPALRPPAWVCSTDHDRIIRADQFRLAAERIPNARCVQLSPVGHCPMLEVPDRFCDALGVFLDEVQPVAPPAPATAPAESAAAPGETGR